jgi:TolB protein
VNLIDLLWTGERRRSTEEVTVIRIASRLGAVAGAALMLLSLGPVTAAQAAPTPGGRLLYLQFDGSTTQGPGQLKSAKPDGSAVQDFGRQLAWYSYPDYSPDGSRIAYVEGWSFRTMAADGSDDQWLVDGPSIPAYPRWSPDGKWIAAESDGDIWKVSPAGYESGWVNVTGAYNSNDLTVAWAPGGRRFATADRSSVRIYSADGRRTRTLAELDGAYRLAWNPNGRTLAVEARGDIWLVDAVTGAATQVTRTPETEVAPNWSPDGRWLAYGKGPGTADPVTVTDPQIWLMNQRGGNQHTTGIAGVPTSWRAQA